MPAAPGPLPSANAGLDMIVDERRHAADLLSTLTPGQLRTPSLCAGWTVHDVAAHLTTYLRYGQLKIYLGILATGADLDRVNGWLTRRAARRSDAEIVEVLRRRAGSRTTVPRSGYDPVPADLVLHDLDIRRPLGIPCDLPEDRLAVAFHHPTSRPSPGTRWGRGWTGCGSPPPTPAGTPARGRRYADPQPSARRSRDAGVPPHPQPRGGLGADRRGAGDDPAIGVGALLRPRVKRCEQGACRC